MGSDGGRLFPRGPARRRPAARRGASRHPRSPPKSPGPPPGLLGPTKAPRAPEERAKDPGRPGRPAAVEAKGAGAGIQRGDAQGASLQTREEGVEARDIGRGGTEEEPWRMDVRSRECQCPRRLSWRCSRQCYFALSQILLSWGCLHSCLVARPRSCRRRRARSAGSRAIAPRTFGRRYPRQGPVSRWTCRGQGLSVRHRIVLSPWPLWLKAVRRAQTQSALTYPYGRPSPKCVAALKKTVVGRQCGGRADVRFSRRLRMKFDLERQWKKKMFL